MRVASPRFFAGIDFGVEVAPVGRRYRRTEVVRYGLFVISLMEMEGAHGA